MIWLESLYEDLLKQHDQIFYVNEMIPRHSLQAFTYVLSKALIRISKAFP